MPHVLIFTAGFGEGHNTAARSLSSALAQIGIDSKVVDPFQLARPALTRHARRLYLGMIERAPFVWKPIYDLLDHSPTAQRMATRVEPVACEFERQIREHCPAAVVATYPLFGSFWKEVAGKTDPPRCPFVSVVTDSLTIHSLWMRGKIDHWCVTDDASVRRLVSQGAAAECVHATGFAVDPRFAHGAREVTQAPEKTGARILLFPTSSRHRTSALIDTFAGLPDPLAWSLTVALGGQKDRLRPLFEVAQREKRLPLNLNFVGWCDDMPSLYRDHHIVVGKAGGATVHEARAAARPMLIHTTVPGQEEGNAELLESEGGGWRLRGNGDLVRRLNEWRADDFALWHQAHQNLLHKAPADGAAHIARLVVRVAGEDGGAGRGDGCRGG